MPLVSLVCPRCASTSLVDDIYAGHTIGCTHCQLPLIVPRVAEAAVPPPPVVGATPVPPPVTIPPPTHQPAYPAAAGITPPPVNVYGSVPPAAYPPIPPPPAAPPPPPVASPATYWPAPGEMPAAPEPLATVPTSPPVYEAAVPAVADMPPASAEIVETEAVVAKPSATRVAHRPLRRRGFRNAILFLVGMTLLGMTVVLLLNVKPPPSSKPTPSANP